jgi:carbonic anhydrase
MISRIFLASLAIIGSVSASNLIDYSTHGTNWEGLCKTGTKQSPIEISPIRSMIYHDLHVSANYENVTNGYLDQSGTLYTIHFNTTGFISLTSGEHWYSTPINSKYCIGNTMELHIPSEHTFGGNHYDVELEILHKNARVSIFFDVVEGGNQTSPFIEELNLDKKFFRAQPLNLPLNELISKAGEGRITIYDGSKPYPGCEEDVKWFIFENPLPITSY